MGKYIKIIDVYKFSLDSFHLYIYNTHHLIQILFIPVRCHKNLDVTHNLLYAWQYPSTNIHEHLHAWLELENWSL